LSQGFDPVLPARPDAFRRLDLTPTRRGLLLGGTAAAFVAATRKAIAQDGAPFRIVIAFPPGGTSTASTQPMLEPLRAKLGAPVTQVYKPGAGGDVAAIEVINSPPDGRTMFFGHAGPLAINPHITVLRAFDPLTALAPLAQVVQFPIVVCAHTKLGISDIKALIALGQTRQLVVGSSGNGSVQHLAGEAFKRKFGLHTLHLPFAGGGPVQEALTKGALDVLCETGSNVVRHIREGRLAALAVMSKQRLATLPDTPTFAELGYDGLEVSAWFGLLVPAATPQPLQDTLATAVLSVLEDATVQKALTDIGGLPAPLAPKPFGEFIAAEHARWGKFIQDAGLKPTGTDAGASIGTPR
jgi:tripartite-type tricarboxylate transporter receptor subunit TctC